MRALFAAMLATSTIAACGGGGGGGGSDTPIQNFTYFEQDGLTWSSTSQSQLRLNPSMLSGEPASVPFNQDANYYCSGSKNNSPDNFNKSAGWRLPTYEELTALKTVNPKPTNWILGYIWTDIGVSVNFSDSEKLRKIDDPAYVVCVKK